jgi:hypothetical protein
VDQKGNRILGDYPEVIFLIGARASVSVGIPAMHGIFNSFMDKTRSGISNKEKEICRMFIKELGIDEDLEEFLLTANLIIQAESTRLLKFTEKLISPQESSNLRQKFRNNLAPQIQGIKSLRDHILEFSSKTCFRFDRDRAIELYSGFVKVVSLCSYPIFTTNYDYVFEDIAEEKNITVYDNFVKKGRRLIWNSDIDFPYRKGLTIIKLHGSVTWYADREDGTIDKIDKDTSINSIGHDIDRLVIFPTRFKDIYDQHFFALYSQFLTSLAFAKCLIIIGHSLRDEYLKAGIIERIRKGRFQVIIIDPNFPQELPAEMQPTRIGTAGKITHIPYTFEDFSDELASILQESSPEKVAIECAKVVHHVKFKTNKIKIKGNIRILKPDQIKNFKLNVDAYFSREEKPAYIYAWLAANYSLPNGEKKNEISANFINEQEIKIADGLSGFFKKEISVTAIIPNIVSWLEQTSKIKLKVAILSKEIKKPSQILPKNILCQDQRELLYSK